MKKLVAAALALSMTLSFVPVGAADVVKAEEPIVISVSHSYTELD